MALHNEIKVKFAEDKGFDCIIATLIKNQEKNGSNAEDGAYVMPPEIHFANRRPEQRLLGINRIYCMFQDQKSIHRRGCTWLHQLRESFLHTTLGSNFWRTECGTTLTV
jgi:hypothetical protein